MKKHIILFIAIFFASVLHAQTINIRGTVTDTSNETLPGVSITIKGTQTGTVSDANGNYSIRAQRGNVLEFTFVGMVKQSVTVGKQNVINIQMAADAINLDEVVAIGYGIAKKSDLTGAVASIKSENLTNSKVGTVTTALQGLAAGVQVTTGSVKPGGDASVVIRGVGSLRAGSEPLYIVDGIPVQGGLQDLSSGDIESIEILKDASSASIYGSRGSNGVVLVTTKKGTSGKAKISLNASFGTQRMLNKQDLMNAQQYYELVSIAQPNYKWTSEELRLLSRGESTDWQDAVTQNGQYQNYNFSISGGKNDIQHFLGVDWYDQKGTIKNSSFNKLTVRYNMDAKLNKWLRYGVRFNVIESKLMNINEEADSGYGTMFSAISSQPTAPIYTEDGEYFDGFLNTRANPVAIVDLLDKATLKSRFVGSAYIEIEPIKNLKLRSDNGGELVFYKVNTYEDGRMGQHYTAGGHANVMSNKKRYWQTENTATYSFDINKEHQLSAMAGFSASRTDYEEVTADSKKLSSILKYYNLQGAEEHGPNSSYAVPSSLVSFYGRFNYNFSNRYLATLTMRGAGSSRFAPDSRWANFPSLSAGWVASEEQFIKNLDWNWLSFLKLRGSWGTLGNERITMSKDNTTVQNYYPYQSALNFGSALFYSGNTVNSFLTAAQQYYAVRNISWETTETWDIGLDANFLDGRLHFTGDFYKKKTKDMLLALEIPKFIGYDNPSVNTGNMHTTGYDLEIGWRDQVGDFRYSVSANLSDFISKMGNLGGTEFLGEKVKMEGSQFDEWYGYLSDGLFQTQKEVDNSPKLNNNVTIGDIKYKDISGPDGVPDGKISSEYDRVLLGGSLPRYMFGVNLSASYKGFDISMMFQGVGSQNSRISRNMVEGLNTNWGGFPSILEGDYWSTNNTAEQNAGVKYPRLTRNSVDANMSMSDYWMFNGRYLRMKNLTVGYTLPSVWTKKISMESVRFYASGSDLFCLSKYPHGWDPEVSATGYPITMSVLLGVSVNF